MFVVLCLRNFGHSVKLQNSWLHYFLYAAVLTGFDNNVRFKVFTFCLANGLQDRQSRAGLPARRPQAKAIEKYPDTRSRTCNLWVTGPLFYLGANLVVKNIRFGGSQKHHIITMFASS